MSDQDDRNNSQNSRTERLEAAFKNARVNYDELKEEFFKVKEDLTAANERLDQEYSRWKKARHDNMARTPTAISPYGAAAVAQTRFDNAQKEYDDIQKELFAWRRNSRKRMLKWITRIRNGPAVEKATCESPRQLVGIAREGIVASKLIFFHHQMTKKRRKSTLISAHLTKKKKKIENFRLLVRRPLLLLHTGLLVLPLVE
jgi:hypothetical protein